MLFGGSLISGFTGISVILCTSGVFADDCVPRPISLDISNVTLSNSKTAWGIGMTVGTPGQPMAVMPQWPLNSTMLYGIDGHCELRSADEWSEPSCITFRGGAYNSSASNTSTTNLPSSLYTVDTVARGWPYPYPGMDHVADTLNVAENTTLLEFPLNIAQSAWDEQAYLPMMALGLGTNSTILNVLKSSGRIVSRSWSFFFGSWGWNSRMNGQFTIGGYDAGRVTGKGSEHSLALPSSPCPSRMVVSVTGMELEFANGTSASIMGSSESSALAVCLYPSVPTMMRMPIEPYFNNFMRATKNSVYKMDRTEGIYYWNMRYPASIPPYDGDLTITLDTGFKVTVPNDLLVVPHLYLDQETGDTVSNATEPDLLIDSLQDIEQDLMAMFGSIFFSVVYLSANYDTGKFTLWRANRSPDAVADMRSLGTDGEDHMSFCAAATADIHSNITDSTGGTDATSGTDSASGSDSTGDTIATTADDGGLATGTIVGIGVGVVGALLVVIGVLVWWIWRGRRKAAASKAAELEDSVKREPPPESTSFIATSSDGTQFDGTQFDGAQFNATQFDTTQFNATQFNGAHYDGTHYDGTHYDGTSFDGTSFDGTQRPELHDQPAHKYELPVSGQPVFFELPGQRY